MNGWTFILSIPVYMFITKHVDITFSAHDEFLEWPSSGTIKAKVFESQTI